MSSEASFDELVELAVGRGLVYIGFRARTVLETQNKLIQKGIAEDVVRGAIARLIEMDYLDDRRFALSFVEDRRNLDGWGNSRIRTRLIALGADRGAIDAAFAVEDEETELQRAVAFLDTRLTQPAEANADRRRAMGLLVRRGYTYETASDAIRAHARAHS